MTEAVVSRVYIKTYHPKRFDMKCVRGRAKILLNLVAVSKMACSLQHRPISSSASRGLHSKIQMMNVSSSTLISHTQKLKLMREGGHFTYSSTLPLTCSSHRAQTWNRSRVQFILINRVR
jgi:hypothetical protein